ncbi:protein-tyrosine-phosphatase [Bosea sp. BE271]|uniref:arsenate reductase ArsC n=1 Tax=Bosea TaxID=85413 RepID=UPI00285B939A|nr:MULTISPECIES: arsenate reductase ArsC [Bosea]MDR6828995.1 protein-tyrosine-phosphatase [Bosea robiniae]MDR6895879.1 protein-tyrosine-phosphatase [Bosea sp. BE109]MDR7139276.1 protein-tyrosine-phosphatase [Bosea sp. BE168]MDR7175975.1 protein-tyrosine-phosphatase [Bosea sp. BE271]
MPDRVHNVLFLCTHNSARSIMAEALLNHLGEGRFRAFSAGSEGGPGPKPMALKVLEAEGIPTEGLSSKTWDIFAQPGAPVMDLVITVCDQAAGEACPHWPGQPITAHWGIEDPSNLQDSEIERERAFVTALRYLRNRINVLLSLPVASLDEMALAQQVRRIGALEGASGHRPEVA